MLTGGHHNSALAVVEELNKLGKHHYLWLGHRHSVWGDRSDSAEYQEVTRRKIPFVDLKAGKLYKTFNPAKLARLPRGLVSATYHLIRFRPNLILSFGGYLAAPTAIAGYLLRIPIYTHEQTSVAGWSNRLIGKLAQKVFITWPQSANFFPKNKVVISGLPLRKEILKIKQTKLKAKGQKLKAIYITGGKQGSHAINQVVKEALPELTKQYQITHQCGAVSFLDSKKALQRAKEKLPHRQQVRYRVDDYYTAKPLATIYQKADFVICRGGAHTIYELAYLGKPAIIIPIPWVSHQEQLINAQILEKAGSAIILPEKKLNATNLINTCNRLTRNPHQHQKSGRELAETVRSDAASKIATTITKQQQTPPL